MPNEAVLSGWSERLLAPDRLRRTDALDVPAGSSVAFDVLFPLPARIAAESA